MTPITTGSEKQITWAESLRATALASIEAAIADETSEAAKRAVSAYSQNAEKWAPKFRRPDPEATTREERVAARAARRAWIVATLTEIATALRATDDASTVINVYARHDADTAAAAAIADWFYVTFVVNR